jgi:ATP-dependent DNA helicase RecG
MKKVDEILHKLEGCLLNDKYESIETESIELKDLSGGDVWRPLYISACAFLNTDGGIIICGVNENEQSTRYTLTGFDRRNENRLEEKLRTSFTDENDVKLDLSAYFKYEFRNLSDKEVCVVYVEKLPEDEKFVFYRDKKESEKFAYRRIGTKKTKILKDGQDGLIARLELKEELRYAQELTSVPNASTSDLNLDKLAEFIFRYNSEMSLQTYRKDIEEAKSFMTKRQFIRNNNPTYLGMLVCGDNLFETIGNRADVSCFVDSIIDVADNKKNLRDNIIPLMDNAVSFVYKNIQIGVSYEKGGAKLPEYPEKLIREVINNSLAHRDYKIDRFVSIDIKPNVSISVNNPGRFRQEQIIYFGDAPENIRVRRLIPISKPKNPRLADILKFYDKYEAKTKGMSSLINSCLNNEIDVPYYDFRHEEISLTIPKGKVYDDEIKLWLDSFSAFIYEKLNKNELTEEEKIVLAFIYKSERLNRLEHYTILFTKDHNHRGAIARLEEKGLIYKHPKSEKIDPIYLVNRTLAKIEFSEELVSIFGSHYDWLSNDDKEVLSSIYLHNHFSRQKVVTANLVSSYLYHKKNGGFIKDEKDYQNYKRKIRNIFNKLTIKEFIVNLNQDNLYRPEYTVNEKFSSPQPPFLNF